MALKKSQPSAGNYLATFLLPGPSFISAYLKESNPLGKLVQQLFVRVCMLHHNYYSRKKITDHKTMFSVKKMLVTYLMKSTFNCTHPSFVSYRLCILLQFFRTSYCLLCSSITCSCLELKRVSCILWHRFGANCLKWRWDCADLKSVNNTDYKDANVSWYKNTV